MQQVARFCKSDTFQRRHMQFFKFRGYICDRTARYHLQCRERDLRENFIVLAEDTPLDVT